MKRILPAAIAALVLQGCGQSDAVAPQANDLPPLESLGDTPGDWSGLSGAIGRPPGESGLFVTSVISTDLHAMLGRDIAAFREAMVDAGALRRTQDNLLVSRSDTGAGWIVLQPSDHAIAVGFRTEQGWRTHRTPGSDVPIPDDLRLQ